MDKGARRTEMCRARVDTGAHAADDSRVTCRTRDQMHFTRLRLNGFKSFVDPTDLVIREGLTGVVGPNGCGKSNLLEALRWVMGESRPTAMRGGGMEDVIFAGTSTRPAKNFAEVALSVDTRNSSVPPAFEAGEAIEIVRRITRDAGSAYKAQGRDVRARDVQMLFADASTGAHSPALVRQGQISELIHAKPKNRRRILEDAAGIAGLYQRRHEAELKLKGAEQNLARLDDTVEALAQQLAQLARQAKQAAIYREVAERLREAEGVLLFRRWSEAADGATAASAALRDRGAATSEAERKAARAVAARQAVEARLPDLREEDSIASALVQRLEVEAAGLSDRARQAEQLIERLAGRLRQLDRDGEREAALNADADDSIARLEAELAEIRAAEEAQDGRLEAARDAAREADAVLSEREGALAEATEGVARLAAQHQSADRAVAEAEKARARAATAAREAETAVERSEGALAEATDRVARAGEDRAAAVRAARTAEADLTAAEEARGAAQAEEAEARAAMSEAAGGLGALTAEHRALAGLLSRDEEVGETLMDRVRVADGFEAALGASLADELRAPVGGDGTGWAELPAQDELPAPLPGDAEPLSEHVTAPAFLSRRLVRVGVVDPEAGDALQPRLRPGQRLVSRAGHLWRWDGYRGVPADAPSEAALRLEQRNRAEALERRIAEAEAHAEEAASRHREAETRLTELSAADRAAREARRAADRAVSEIDRAMSRAEADRDLAAGRRETARDAVGRHDEEAAGAERRLGEARTARDALDDVEAARARAEDVKTNVEAARITAMTRRATLDEVTREGEARARRAATVERDLSSWRDRLGTAGGRLTEIRARGERTEQELVAARHAPERIAAERRRCEAALAQARARAEAARPSLAQAEEDLREAADAERRTERAAGEAREARAAAEAQEAAARTAVAEADARIREALEIPPATLRERLGEAARDMPHAERIEAEIARLRHKRESLGAVNLRAEEDAREVEEEHGGLIREKADLEAAIAELRRGIAGLNREGRERLLTAFEEVNASFGRLFATLFGGGEARLELIESDDPLDAGLEILCQPPGKKLSVLSLLSGGEQTLTAMALIFAVFLANPAPICVLDEVDAPLDDANVTRFCDLLDEMTRQTETRFLIITHHAVTMARMDRLFGVTMGEQGVSQLVSVDLRHAEAMVA